MAEAKDQNPEIFDISEFLQQNYKDTFVLVTKSNYHILPRPLFVVFDQFKIKGKEMLKKWSHLKAIYKISLKFQNTVHFAVMDFEDASLLHMDWFRFFNYDFDYWGWYCYDWERPLPFVFGVDINDRQHEFSDFFSTDTLISFCKALEKNELYFSEPIPPLPSAEQNAEQNVEKIVADNFRKLVEHNDDKDVIVTIHSEITFDRELNLRNVPKVLQNDNDSLVFYAIIYQRNYIPFEYRTWDFPTSFLIPRNDKSKRLRHVHKHLDGPATLAFIAKNSSSKLKTVDRCGLLRSNRSINIEQESYSGSMDYISTKMRNIVWRLNDDNHRSYDDDGFPDLLESILKKVNGSERYEIEMEIVMLALKRLK